MHLNHGKIHCSAQSALLTPSKISLWCYDLRSYKQGDGGLSEKQMMQVKRKKSTFLPPSLICWSPVQLYLKENQSNEMQQKYSAVLLVFLELHCKNRIICLGVIRSINIITTHCQFFQDFFSVVQFMRFLIHMTGEKKYIFFSKDRGQSFPQFCFC